MSDFVHRESLIAAIASNNKDRERKRDRFNCDRRQKTTQETCIALVLYKNINQASRYKFHQINQSKINFISHSKWVYNNFLQIKETQNSPIDYIQYSINVNKFKSKDKIQIRKKLKIPNNNILIPENKVHGCVSEVFVEAGIKEGKLYWEGYSDALITKGLLAFLINGLNELTPKEVLNINTKFIEDTGLKASLTPSRSNGFLNILLKI